MQNITINKNKLCGGYVNQLKQQGFNLIELLIVVAMIGILAVIAAPSMSAWIANSKLVTERDKVYKGFQYARSKAVERNLPYLICSTTTGTTCATDADWGSGWLVAQTNVSAGIIANVERVEQSLNAASYTVTADQALVQFLSSGIAAPGITVNFCHNTLTDLDGQSAEVSTVGRASRASIPNGGGVCP